MNKIIGVCPSCGGPVFDNGKTGFKVRYCSDVCLAFANNERNRRLAAKRRGTQFWPGTFSVYAKKHAEMLEKRTPDNVKRWREFLAKRDAEYAACGLPKPKVTVVNGVRVEQRGTSFCGGSSCGTLRQLYCGNTVYVTAKSF